MTFHMMLKAISTELDGLDAQVKKESLLLSRRRMIVLTWSKLNVAFSSN
jgi:hypothetical protein